MDNIIENALPIWTILNITKEEYFKQYVPEVKEESKTLISK